VADCGIGFRRSFDRKGYADLGRTPRPRTDLEAILCGSLLRDDGIKGVTGTVVDELGGWVTIASGDGSARWRSESWRLARTQGLLNYRSIAQELPPVQGRAPSEEERQRGFLQLHRYALPGSVVSLEIHVEGPER